MFHLRYAEFQEIIVQFMRGSLVILTKITIVGGIRETRREGNEGIGGITGEIIDMTEDADAAETMIRLVPSQN
jgi:hypothetical protein